MNLTSLIQSLLSIKDHSHISSPQNNSGTDHKQLLGLKNGVAVQLGDTVVSGSEDDYLDYSTEIWLGSMTEKPRWGYDGGSL